MFAVDPMMSRNSGGELTVRTTSGLVVESQSSLGADGSSREREDEDPEVILFGKSFLNINVIEN